MHWRNKKKCTHFYRNFAPPFEVGAHRFGCNNEIQTTLGETRSQVASFRLVQCYEQSMYSSVMASFIIFPNWSARLNEDFFFLLYVWLIIFVQLLLETVAEKWINMHNYISSCCPELCSVMLYLIRGAVPCLVHVPYHFLPCVSCHMKSCCAASYGFLPCRVMSCRVKFMSPASCRVPWRVLPCRIVFYRERCVVSCHIHSCPATLCSCQ